MARASLLTESQCTKIRKLREKGHRATTLAKRFGVSESSLYKVLDHSYIARPDAAVSPARQPIPVVPPAKPHGATVSIFGDKLPKPGNAVPLDAIVRQAAQLEAEVDELTLAAAELVVAQARFHRVAHNH